MEKKEIRIIAIFCAVLLVLAGCILLRYYHRISNYYATIENAAANDISAYLTGFHYTTTNSQLTTSEDPDGTTSRRTFTHTVYTQDDRDFITVTVNITGNIASDNIDISHISTSLSEDHPENLTVSEHLFGETATVILYINQISICHFQYRLSADGSIDHL